ncbi:MAG: histidine kinase [Spirosomataceae bacterium]
MIKLLTSKQKWQLAIRLLLLYTPLLLYINLPEKGRNWDGVLYILPFFLIFSIIALGMYYIWISATDLIQRQLFIRFGRDFLMEFNWLGLLLTLIISLGLAMLYSLAFQYILKWLFELIYTIWPEWIPKQSSPNLHGEVMAYIKRTNIGFSVVVMLSAFNFTITTRAYQQLKDVRLKAQELEKEAALAQFEALKSQVSPHFLFNSLSILTSLVHEDANLSEQFIKQLSKAYRYILEQRDQELVALKTELDFIQSYAFLLKIRFENKFELAIDIPNEVQSQFRIAPLSLQMLVENAVKHNRMSVREPLRVRIYCEDSNLVVENPLQARDQREDSTGVGLRNITNRYSLMTDRKVWFGESHGAFVVKIPLL